MVSLTDFSSTLNTQNGMCALPMQEVVSGKSGVEYYPEIFIICEAFNTSGGSIDFESSPSLLVPTNEPPLKRIIRTFFENGIQEAILEARNDRTSMESPAIKSAADFAYRIVEFLYQMKTKIFPALKVKGPSAVASFSETRDWLNSKVRYISWHPNCFKIAIAGCDDVVRIYNDTTALPSLRASSQKWISCMAWRPFTASNLAVAGKVGICYWSIDNTNFNRQMVCGTVLKHPNHAPVQSIEWNPDGSLLASASINSTDILIWDVDKVASAPLKRVGLPCSLLKWSPDGTSLFSSTVGNVFRVWAPERKWTPERWTTGNGSIQSAAWSPCGTFLLFVNSNEPILYQLQFVEEQLFANGAASTKQALPIADLQKVLINDNEFGGLPQSIAWDPNGCYLAVIFKDSPNVAVFSTTITKYNLSISPSCYLSGNSENPSFICFQSKTPTNSNSVLTIGWSGGRIQYFSLL